MSFWTFQFFRRIVYHRDIEQAQRRAAGDRSGRIFSEKYVFMSKNMTFGSLGSLLPFSKSPPPKLIKKQKFSKMIFFAVFLCHIEPTCQKLCISMVTIVTFGSLGSLLPFSKASPSKLIKNGNFQK